MDRNRGIAISRRARNWPDVFDDKKAKPVILGFSLAGFVYGLLHLSAWGAPFPSAVQRLLWKLSSFTLVSSGIAIIVLIAILELAPRLWMTFKYRISAAFGDFIFGSSLLIFIFVVGAYSLLYIFVRICLVVECFLSLTHLPEAIFKMPQWSTYLPHIS